MITAEVPLSHRDALLAQHLQTLFSDLGAQTLSFLRQHLRWVEIGAGEVLMEEGAPGDSAYLSISGRFRVYVKDDEGQQRMVRELSRGEVIGEMSLFSGEPRSATVVAVRDSVLVRLDKPQFEALLASSPQVTISLTRQIIRRLQTQNQRRPIAAPVMIAVLPATSGVALADFARKLAAQLARHGRVRVVDSAAIDRELNGQGIAAADDAGEERRIAAALDEIEAANDFVLMLADDAPNAWVRRCIRHADETLLVAEAAQEPSLHPIEQAFLAGRTSRSEAAETLVLLHPAGLMSPRGTRKWLARRPVSGHVHIRPELERDMARLGRLLSRNANGLVLAGGGARGFAHLGIWSVLAKQGVEVDWIGGTSIGALMAVAIASDRPVETVIEVARDSFKVSPTGDYNLLPLVSLIKGGRARSAVDQAMTRLFGGAIDVEDTWKNFFCITTNYSKAAAQPVHRGDLSRSLRASIAIPGALPPVVLDGDLLCDGGTFNNFPVDVMREMRGVGHVIGVDLGARNLRQLEFDEVPSSWQLLRDRMRPRSKRRYRLPSLTSYLMNITILYSISQQPVAKRMTDLYFNPPLHKVGLLQWNRFDDIVRQGREHALDVLGKLPDEQRAALGLAA